MGRLDGKVAMISGAAGGLGAAFAQAFASEGARVLMGDVQDAAGQQAAEHIKAGGAEAWYLHLDVTREEDWHHAMEEAVRRCGKLDILVNNAGVLLKVVPIEQREVDDWDRLMAVNVKGVFLGTKYAIPVMRSNGGGSIVNMSSIAGIGQSHITDSAYAASKGAVRIFTKVTAAQYARDGIRCNSVHPGPIDVGMLKDVLSDSVKLQQRLTRIPMGRMGKVSEVVGGVVYLASDDSSYTTGTELVIDGGALAQ